jgi:phosphatidylinositol-3-phosphatase
MVFPLLVLSLTQCIKDEIRPASDTESFSSEHLARPVYDHIFVVWLENKSRDEVWNDSSCPYMNELIDDGTLFSRYYCYTNAYSQPNYVASFAGTRCGVVNNTCLSGRPLTQRNLYTQLKSVGRTFATYCEGIPSAGSTVCTSGRYVRKHNAPINFSNVPTSVILPFPLPSNFSSYPTVTWIIPDQYNNGHDTGESYADNWLRTTIKPMVEYCKVPSNNSLFILAFDEGSGTNRKVATTFVGNRVKQDYVISTYYDIGHYNLIHTILSMYGAVQIGSAASYSSLSGWYY